VWPSNQLRLYILFSAPMSRGDAASHIHVRDVSGKEPNGSHAIFLPGEELWDPGFRRLTMTFDPGRIKRGLTSNETIGPPLVEGKRYTLAIDADWPDARGVPMVAGFRKTFRGGPAVRIPPDPRQWSVMVPKNGTMDALVVDFPVPMNYPLLQRMLRISGARSNVPGTVTVTRQETEWRFSPQQLWTAGNYQLVIDTGLEDLAGNHIGQPFELGRLRSRYRTHPAPRPFRRNSLYKATGLPSELHLQRFSPIGPNWSTYRYLMVNVPASQLHGCLFLLLGKPPAALPSRRENGFDALRKLGIGVCLRAYLVWAFLAGSRKAGIFSAGPRAHAPLGGDVRSATPCARARCADAAHATRRAVRLRRQV
jgi:hypothetical protein